MRPYELLGPADDIPSLLLSLLFLLLWLCCPTSPSLTMVDDVEKPTLFTSVESPCCRDRSGDVLSERKSAALAAYKLPIRVLPLGLAHNTAPIPLAVSPNALAFTFPGVVAGENGGDNTLTIECSWGRGEKGVGESFPFSSPNWGGEHEGIGEEEFVATFPVDTIWILLLLSVPCPLAETYSQGSGAPLGPP